MDFRKMVRGPLVLAGLAAAMLLTPSAHSQEITNSTFDDGPNVAAFDQTGAAQPSAQQAPVASDVPASNEAASTEATLATTTNQETWVDSPWLSAGLTLLLFACIAVSVLGGSKRTKQNSYAARPYPSYRDA